MFITCSHRKRFVHYWPKNALKFHFNNEKYFAWTSKDRDKIKYQSVYIYTLEALLIWNDCMSPWHVIHTWDDFHWWDITYCRPQTRKSTCYSKIWLIWYDNKIFQGQTISSLSASLSKKDPTRTRIVCWIELRRIASRHNGCWSRPTQTRTQYKRQLRPTKARSCLIMHFIALPQKGLWLRGEEGL